MGCSPLRPQELDDYLLSQEVQDQCKREMLYHKWSERVFGPIQRCLAAQLNGPAHSTLDSRRRRLFEQYLKYRNTKVCMNLLTCINSRTETIE